MMEYQCKSKGRNRENDYGGSTELLGDGARDENTELSRATWKMLEKAKQLGNPFDFLDKILVGLRSGDPLFAF